MYFAFVPRRSAARLGFAATALLGAAFVACAVSACGLGPGADALFGAGGGGAGGGEPTGGSPSSSSSTSSSTSSGPSSSSSSSGASTSSSSTGSSSSSSGKPGTEDCTNGVDDDGDGLVDCADPDCTVGYECVDALPGGWEGYYHVTQQPYAAGPPPQCPGGAPADVRYAGPAGPAMCNACSCSAVQGVQCSAPALTCWAGSNSCFGGGASWTAALQDGACHKPTNLLGFNQALSCQVTGPSVPSGTGSCAPQGGGFPNKAPWSTEVVGCSAGMAGGGCGTGKACIAKHDPGESTCIRKNGNASCPAGWTAVALQTYASGTDTRACTACTCGTPAKLCSGAAYTIYDLDQCATMGQSDPPAVISATACTDASVLLDQGSWSAQLTLPQTGACPPDGGKATGSVQPSGDAMYCCR